MKQKLFQLFVCYSIAGAALCWGEKVIAGTPCSDFQSNSCWSADNHASSDVTIKCNTNYPWETRSFDFVIAAGKSDSLQFSRGFGDGLGYPEPGVQYYCSASLKSGKTATVGFSTLNWGDVVQFKVTETYLELKLQEYWSPHRTVVKNTPF